MPPTAPRSWPRWSASSPRATRRWSATPAIAASSRRSATSTSPSIATRSRRTQRFDGVFVLRTNTDLNPLDAMLCYKQLWTVEQTFRTAKHLFATRPIFHKLDETIRGHVFCSFLALVLKKSAGGPHRRARPRRLLARDHRRSRFADRDRDRAGRQALHRPLRAASCRQPRPARGRRRAAAHRSRGRRRLIRRTRKCSAKPPSRR